MSYPLSIIIVEKGGSLKTLNIKNFNIDELYKKCGFKKSEDFVSHVEWPVKVDGQKYLIQMFGKDSGKANTENKYDFPPPIDNKLFFGSCALIGMIKDVDGDKKYINLSMPLWNKIYDKLFGGFEDLALTGDDDDEEDELENIPKHMKTKQGGYLKDGFVVDNSYSEDEESCVENTELIDNQMDNSSFEDDYSELSEDSYV